MKNLKNGSFAGRRRVVQYHQHYYKLYLSHRLCCPPLPLSNTPSPVVFPQKAIKHARGTTGVQGPRATFYSIKTQNQAKPSQNTLVLCHNFNTANLLQYLEIASLIEKEKLVATLSTESLITEVKKKKNPNTEVFHFVYFNFQAFLKLRSH